jgi:hypothetical protein
MEPSTCKEYSLQMLTQLIPQNRPNLLIPLFLTAVDHLLIIPLVLNEGRRRDSSAMFVPATAAAPFFPVDITTRCVASKPRRPSRRLGTIGRQLGTADRAAARDWVRSWARLIGRRRGIGGRSSGSAPSRSRGGSSAGRRSPP